MSGGTDGEQTNHSRGERKNEELFVEYYDFHVCRSPQIPEEKADAQDVVQSLSFELADAEIPAMSGRTNRR
jgi:hypothetical protein